VRQTFYSAHPPVWKEMPPPFAEEEQRTKEDDSTKSFVVLGPYRKIEISG
jgi:hypothetical protein